MKASQKHLPYTLLFLLVLIVGCIYLFHDSIHLYPAYVHSWTQSDRLAIAMNFQENGFDFFHPATFNLLTEGGITQVDFPIHDYLVAIFSSIFKVDLISSFRLYNLLFSMVGAYYLFKSALLLQSSAAKAFLSSLFIYTIPFFVFYQNGFLPSVPSIGLFFIGIYHWLLYRSNEQRKSNYGIAILAFTIAALARIPFTIFTIAILLEMVWTSIEKRKVVLYHIVLPIIGLSTILSYFLYNQHLAESYGSMFLSELLHAESIGDYLTIFYASFQKWSFDLIGPFQLIFLLLLLLLGLKQGIFGSLSLRKSSYRLKFLLISILGVLAYTYLMALQFKDHDYYYMDSLLPVFSIAFVIYFGKVQIPQNWYTPIASFSLIGVLVFYASAKNSQELRYDPASNSRLNYAYNVFDRAKADLKQWGVDTKDTLAFIDIGSTNIPFTIYGNKGYTTLNSGKYAADEILSKDFQHAFLLDSFKVSDSYFDYPDIAKQLKLEQSNGEISMFSKNESESVDQFFQQLHFRYQNDFDQQIYTTGQTSKHEKLHYWDDRNRYTLPLDSTDEFLLTSKIKANEEFDQEIGIAVNMELYAEDSIPGLRLVFSSKNYYFAYFLENHFEPSNEWQKKYFTRKVPAKYFKSGDELKVYLWNPEGSSCYIDNYHLIVYE